MAKIETAAQRRKLPVSKHPVWCGVGETRSGVKLGYRKGARGGVWIAKTIDGTLRRETVLGPAADGDAAPADALAFAAAQVKAREWAMAARKEPRGRAAVAPVTVKQAVEDYIAVRMKKDPRRGADARSRLTRHVLRDEIVANVQLADLTPKALQSWARRLPEDLAPSTINRLMNDFRAALRAETKVQKPELRAALPIVITDGLQALPGATAARCALLSDADTRAVVEAAYWQDEDFGALVLVLASTGARFSQIAAVKVSDVQPDALRIMVPASGKGKGNKARAVLAVPVGEDVIQRLAPVMNGRPGHEPLLLRWVHKQIGPRQWEAVARAAWASSSHMQRGWKKALKAAGVGYVEPYALRHSSIVRGLRAGVPVRIVASLHDTSTAMIERHYSAYILDAADELARRALVPLTTPRPAPFAVVA